MQEEDIINFLKQARVMSGVPFRVQTVVPDLLNVIRYLRGYVTDVVDMEEKQIPMLWQVSGVAVWSEPLKYDLVMPERPINYLQETQPSVPWPGDDASPPQG